MVSLARVRWCDSVTVRNVPTVVVSMLRVDVSQSCAWLYIGVRGLRSPWVATTLRLVRRCVLQRCVCVAASGAQCALAYRLREAVP